MPVHEFEEARKRRQRKKLRKRLIILLAVMAVVVLVFVLKDYIPLIDFDSLLTFGSLNSTENYPVPLQGDEAIDIQQQGNNTLVLTNSRLLSIKPDGSIKSEIKHGLVNPILTTNGRTSLLFDSAGKTLSRYVNDELVNSQTYEYPIMATAVNDDGEFAVVTQARRYAAQITVYDENFNQRYICYSAEHHILSVAFKGSSDELLACGINAEGGVLQSRVYRFSSSSEEALFVKDFSGSLILSAGYLDSGNIYCILDDKLVILNQNGEEVYSYSYADQTLAMFDCDGQNIALLFGNYTHFKKNTIVMISQTGRVLFTSQSTNSISDVRIYEQKVYLLGSGELICLDQNGQAQTLAQPPADATRLLLFRSGAYLLCSDRLEKVIY